MTRRTLKTAEFASIYYKKFAGIAAQTPAACCTAN